MGLRLSYGHARDKHCGRLDDRCFGVARLRDPPYVEQPILEAEIQMIAGVVIDSWKLKIFKKHLEEAGYSYTEHRGLTSGTMLLKVTARSAHQLQPIIDAAQLACKNSRLN